MDEDSPNSEDLIEKVEDQEDDGEELFEIDGNDHESDCQHGFVIEVNDHQNDHDQFFEIDTNIHEDNEQVLELEHGSGSEQVIEVEVSNAEGDTLQVLDIDASDRENNQGNNTLSVDNEDSLSQEKYYPPPVVGMEFESYDDAYNYYNCYAKELGFAIRVKSSWTKRDSKEKRGAVLCCNCEGFKTFKEATNRRKETRTGCLAMIRLRLVESNRWRVDEVKLEHNHLFDPERVQNSKSHKKMEVGMKRKSEPNVDVEVRTIKLYRSPVVDASCSRSFISRESENDQTVETYVWLFRAWLTCMLGRPPQTIVTDRCNAMQGAISDVFPRAHHRFYLPHVIQSILLNSGPFQDTEAFQSVLNRTVYGSLKLDEFEASWDNMIQQFGIRDHEWIQTWYEDREKWAPVYLKGTFLAGLFTVQGSHPLIPFFVHHLHEQISVREFFDLYDLILGKNREKEAIDDLELRGSNLFLRTRCHYELQLSKLYTKEIFQRFQVEVEMMACCLSINQVHATGAVITYLVREREGVKELKSFEVMYDKAAGEIRCICGGFYLNGYLCRHALSVLNHNGVEEIPFSYILPRWRKDCKRLYVPDLGSNVIDISNPTQWHEHLHKRAMQVVEGGMVSQDHYMVAWQAFLESLNKVRLSVNKHV